jgi:hypothetical protein
MSKTSVVSVYNKCFTGFRICCGFFEKGWCWDQPFLLPLRNRRILAQFYFIYCKKTMAINIQLCYLFILAIPIACIAWTVTHEEIFREPREYCIKCSKESKLLIKRKFFYIFTCEYCFSHYVALLFVFFTKFHLLFTDWRGYIIAGFALVWIANIYMSLYNLIRIDIKAENKEIELKEKKIESVKEELNKHDK